MEKINLDIYAGMRGAGKSSVIQKMFTELYAGKRISVIENELGKVTLCPAGGNIQIHTLTSGCVCCSGGVLSGALGTVALADDPEYIVLEPSGAADLRTLEAVCAASGVVVVHRCVYIAKAASVLKLLKVGGDFYREQLQWAGCIYLNFADRLTSSELEETCAAIRKLNPLAAIMTAPLESLTAASFPEIPGKSSEGANLASVSSKRKKILARSHLPIK